MGGTHIAGTQATHTWLKRWHIGGAKVVHRWYLDGT